MKEWDRDSFSVADYEVIGDLDGKCYVKVTWRCFFCDKRFVSYDPPMEHKQECLAYLVNKI